MAEGDDEIIFKVDYKEFKMGLRYDLKNVDKKDIADVLMSVIHPKTNEYAFIFSGIDIKKIENIVRSITGATGSAELKPFSFIAEILQKTKPTELRNNLLSAAGKETLLPAAESYFFNFIIRTYCLDPSMRFGTRQLPYTEEKPQNEVVFSGKYNDWIAIKKLSIDKKTEEWDVSAILSSINNLVVNKAFDFGGIAKNDTLVSKLCSGKRKSYAAVAEVFSKFPPSGDHKEELYMAYKILETLGYKPYAHQEMLVLEHPEVKGFRMRGRKPKV
jgi:hypothetical protein